MANRTRNCVIALIAIAIGLATSFTGGLERLELNSVDARFAIRGEETPNPEITIVALDDTTFSELERPVTALPRRLHARVLHNLVEMGARLVVYDITFIGPQTPVDDRALLSSVLEAGDRVVLATTQRTGGGEPSIAWGFEQTTSGGARIGLASLIEDGDGVLRALEPRKAGITALPLAAAAALDPGAVPPDDERLLVDYAGPAGTYPAVPFSRVLRGRVDPSLIEGRIVFVGATDPLFQDLHPTPFGPEGTSGVEIQANALATALENFPLREAPIWVDIVLIVALSLAGVALWINGRRSLLFTPFVIAFLLVSAQLAFDWGLVVELVPPSISFAVAFVGTGGAELARARTERRRARDNLLRFAPPAVAEELLASGPAPPLGGTELDATVIFIDLSGFTAFSERHPASLVIEALNVYLGAASEVIRDHGGTIVAFLGDGVMAVFGAPVPQPAHADHAVAAAVEMEPAVLAPFERWLAEHGVEDEDVGLGVGVASGLVMSGLVGTEWRTEYSAIGDTTNVAARLQGEAKRLRVPMLMTAATRDRMADASGARAMGEIFVKGRGEALSVFTMPRPGTPGTAG